MSIRKLLRFIAMPFNRSDTDHFYDNLVNPIVDEADIAIVRVDRHPHNDDIDDKIIEQIEQCDFMIADLTYARPSVYFEAGYAQRHVPVIYSARRDHIGKQASTTDPNGNQIVHFDLQMRNTIGWLDGADTEARIAGRTFANCDWTDRRSAAAGI